MQNTANSLIPNTENAISLYGMLMYVSVQEPAKPYVKAGTVVPPGTLPKPLEWKAGVVLTDEDFVDDLESKAKEWDAKLSLKKIRTSEFEGIYKLTPPEDAGKNVWLLTVRKPIADKKGKPVLEKFVPRVYEQVGKTRMEVTNTKLPGNGSMGALSIAVFHMTNGGTLLTLKNVLVTEMIAYVKPEGNYAEGGSEFDIAGDEFGQAVKAETKPATKAVVKPKAKFVGESDEGLDSCPF
jgi:hypothetical protein